MSAGLFFDCVLFLGSNDENEQPTGQERQQSPESYICCIASLHVIRRCFGGLGCF